MDQLDSENSLSLTDMKQELGRAVAMLDKVNTSSPARDFRYVAWNFSSYWMIQTKRGNWFTDGKSLTASCICVIYFDQKHISYHGWHVQTHETGLERETGERIKTPRAGRSAVFALCTSARKALNKKFHFKGASPSFISHLCEREIQILTLFSCGKLLTQASSEKICLENFVIINYHHSNVRYPALEKAIEKDTTFCLSVVYALMVDWQLKVKMARPGPFYIGTV